MILHCKSCGYKEKTSKDLWIKIIGGAMPAGGFYAWVTYLLAGTGLALPIVIAMIGGGIGMLVFKDQITGWIINRGYKCPKCGNCNWTA